MAQQTAIEWFFKQTVDRPWKEVFEEAKQMEKEQIINAFNYRANMKWGSESQINTGEQYYNEIYNK